MPGMRRYVVARLHSGWSYDPGRRAIVSGRREQMSLTGKLPKHTRVVPAFPSLVTGRRPATNDESQLARTYHFHFPEGVPSQQQLDTVVSLPQVEKAWLSPEVSLPRAR